MKRDFWFFLLMLLGLTGLSECTKEEPPKVKEEPAAKSANEESLHLPVVVTDTVVIIPTPKEAMLGFEITDIGGALITAKGVCWSTSHNPTIDNSKVEAGGVFLVVSHCHIGGLENSTTYYVRAYATNSVGTAYGNEVSFTTPESFPPIAFNPDLTYGSVTDVDGNTYKTIQIGPQIWMAENLKTTKYNDDSPILFGTGGPAGFTDWFDSGDGNYGYYNGAYCWYDNDVLTFKDAYGAIYNWHAIGTGKLCPVGWHVPTISEWSALITSLGGLEEPFNERTQSAMIFCDEMRIYESGFTPVFHGELCGWGFGWSDLWWSATPWPTELKVPYAYVIAFRIKACEPQSYGYSVRCLKD